MEKIEEIYREDPTLGYRRMRAMLERELGVEVNHKRVLRLMRKMCLRGISPAPKATRTGKARYPNLLERFKSYRSQSGMVCGYNVYQDQRRICLWGGDNGHVFPEGFGA